jgi:hypothetical protein
MVTHPEATGKHSPRSLFFESPGYVIAVTAPGLETEKGYTRKTIYTRSAIEQNCHTS